MPIATSANKNGQSAGAVKGFKWVAAQDVTSDIGGDVNVEKLKQVSYDFSSESLVIPDIDTHSLIVKMLAD